MSWTQKVLSSRSLAAVAAVGVFGATAFYLGSLDTEVEASNTVEVAASAPSATFPANAGTLGAIPDGGPGCGVPAGTNREVTFTVSGLSGSPTNVEVDMTFSPVHTWGGDVTATLIAPNGTQFAIFGRRGAATPTACGSGNDLAGPYGFADSAAATNWFTVAGTPTPAGDYRSTEVGGSATGGTVTSINPAFASVPDANGTWTLRVNDSGGGDTGTVSAATLTVDAGAAPTGSPTSDFDGDGKTDFAVARQTNVPIAGQVRWFINPSSTGTVVGYDWGIGTTDFFTPADFDGDGKADIATWRPGAADVSAFYILRSSDNGLQIETFGVTGDNPSVVGDYDGDGKADPAVFRAPAGAG
ncbi:MAG TPA: FG-GAP-like repeat-containing protein, partial [Pyrinomonadaceae bacterium]|nr:FG-GAP-like repeat-containing protein [Pyrinomonadaceae bacterium]